jgi:putative glutamine amidotransferase
MSSHKKRIGITLRIVRADAYTEKRDALSHDWPSIIEQVGGYLVLIPNTLSNVWEFLESVHPEGLIFSGGDNIGDDAERDKTELDILSYGIARQVPILGVCRGMQVINQLLGGAIETGVGSEHVNKHHAVNITDDSFALFLKEQTVVNSYHSNIISPGGLAADLKPFALSPDGTVEGFYHTSLPIVGVMWHPERDPSPSNNLLLHNMFWKGKFWLKR